VRRNVIENLDPRKLNEGTKADDGSYRSSSALFSLGRYFHTFQGVEFWEMENCRLTGITI